MNLLFIPILWITVFAQKDELAEDIAAIFGKQDNDGFLGEYEVIPTSTLGTYQAIDKCGEGMNKGVNLCVPYYNCDPDTRNIITETVENTDGFGLIDIR